MVSLYNGTKREWTDYDAVKDNETNIQDIKVALEAAVHRQLMSDVPYGVLLGGLDSSITAVAKKICAKRLSQEIQLMLGIHNCTLQ
jgi:asparagine synthase (glutamine-hydrolysing)